MAYIRVPFADSGDKSAVPVASQTDGSVSFVQGYPVAYSLNPETDTGAKRIERPKMNFLFNAITAAIQEIQQTGIKPYITATENGGTAFAYALGAVVMYNGVIYQSLVANNDQLPTVTANWSPVTNLGNTPGRLLRQIVISTSTSYSPGAGTKQIRVLAIGAGGGGGGSAATTDQTRSCGGGGAGGSAVESLYNVADLTLPIAATPGTPGGAGAAGGASGGAGGTGGSTTFGSLIIAAGGFGGGGGSQAANGSSVVTANGGNNAASTGGNVITSRGAPGLPGVVGNNGNVSGAGGSTRYGAGGNPISAAASTPGDNGTYGGGGSGGLSMNSASPGRAGGAGGAGLIIVWEYS